MKQTKRDKLGRFTKGKKALKNVKSSNYTDLSLGLMILGVFGLILLSNILNH